MGELIVARHELPEDVIALVPMRNVVLFPHVLTAVTVGRAKSIAAVEMPCIPTLHWALCCNGIPRWMIRGLTHCSTWVP